MYVTDSLYEGAFLLYRGHRITIDRENTKHCLFVFPEAAAADAKEFNQGATVPAGLYGESLSHLKRLISESRGVAR